MKRRKLQIAIFILTLMLVSSAFAEMASADAWWGYGARRPDWVLSHGGTIIRFEIDNISGESEEYKAVMYNEGDYVEKEFGTKGLFDDAKNGVYKIKAYRGDGSLEFRTSAEGGKKFDEITVTAHPGETIKLKFDYKRKKVKMTTDYVKPIPKSVVKPVVIPVPEPANETPESITAQTDEIVTATENDDSFIENVEEFIHPDAMAMEVEKKAEIKETENIFKRIWIAIVEFFSFG